MSAHGPLEKTIEQRALKLARAQGDYARKFTSPARRSVPDDVLITDGVTWFCEFKRAGVGLTELQTEEHLKILAAGGFVFTASSVDEFWGWRKAIKDYATGGSTMWLMALIRPCFEEYRYREAA